MSSRRALVLAHEPDCTGGLITERLRQRCFEVTEHVVCPDPSEPNSAEPFPPMDGYDLLVPTGSARSLTAKSEIDSWIHDELDLVRSSHEAGRPILGICFGGQLLADALGGSVEVAPVTEIGWFEIEGDDNPVGAGPWLEWHHDRFIPPPEAEVLADNASAVQLMRIGRSVGTQFHPEVDAAHVKRFLDTTDDEYLDRYGVTRDQMFADARHHEDANRTRCFALVDWFLDDVAGID